MQKTKLIEFHELQRLLPRMKHHPNQLNSLFSSDSELVQLKRNTFISISTDGLAEEYEDRLYTDPETLGWMSVVMSLSDVACSGAQPVGVVLSINWTKSMSPQFKKKFYKGVHACLKQHGTYLLGGDTGQSRSFSAVTTALAQGTSRALQRGPINPGDFLACLSPFGLHAAYAYDYLMKSKFFSQKILRPIVPFKKIFEAKTMLQGSIDNSDGLMRTLSILSDLNHVSFEIDYPEGFFDPRALQFCHKKKIQPASLAWAELGGYELIVVVKHNKKSQFVKKFPHALIFANAAAYQVKKQKIFSDQNVKRSYFQKMQAAIKLSSQL